MHEILGWAASRCSAKQTDEKLRKRASTNHHTLREHSRASRYSPFSSC